MIPALLDGTSVPVLEQVAVFSQARHSLLASNVANIDTPGYQLRDFSPTEFHERLADAIKQRDEGGRTGAVDTVGANYGDPIDNVTQNLRSILYHDDSDVSIEFHTAEIMKNLSQHNMALTVLRSQFELLQAAISERA